MVLRNYHLRVSGNKKILDETIIGVN